MALGRRLGLRRLVQDDASAHPAAAVASVQKDLSAMNSDWEFEWSLATNVSDASVYGNGAVKIVSSHDSDNCTTVIVTDGSPRYGKWIPSGIKDVTTVSVEMVAFTVLLEYQWVSGDCSGVTISSRSVMCCLRPV
ncbi:MAG: hypothetical protein VB858_03355 [Planctomycetaceae bacterium]